MYVGCMTFVLQADACIYIHLQYSNIEYAFTALQKYLGT